MKAQQEAQQVLFSTTSAARALDISVSKLYQLMKDGHLKFVYIGAERRIPAAEIQRIASEGCSA